MSEQLTNSGSEKREELLSHLQKLDSQAFEELLGELWERRGWEAEVTVRSKDRGIDVVATRELPVPLTIVIQAKRYSLTRNVSSTEVQQYSSLRRQREGVDAVAIVTTSGFSDQARETAEALNVKLTDGAELCRLVEDTQAYDIVEKYVDEDVNIADLPSNETNILADDVTHGRESRSELENHMFEGYGLFDTVPADRYESGERARVVHSCSDSPVWVRDGDPKTLNLHTDTAENGLPVYLHLTSDGVRIFARERSGDMDTFTPYDSIVDIHSDSALFGPSESITFNFGDERLRYKFQSMSSEVRGSVEELLEEKVGYVTL